MQALFPDQYKAQIDEFKKRVDKKIGEQEEAIVEEFIRSIPDAPPLDEK
jgi:predicted AlkP superfamily phosphohydrolase/phosphomutase